MTYQAAISGAGLGLRRSLLKTLETVKTSQIQFMEIAPENWIGVGGRLAKQLRSYTERFPFVCHGLSLSIGWAFFSSITFPQISPVSVLIPS